MNAQDPLSLARVEAAEARRRLEGSDLSEWFGPFLPTFASEAVASGGGAVLAQRAGTAVGLMVSDPTERVATVFSRDRNVAGLLAARTDQPWVYSEQSLGPPVEGFGIYVTSLEVPPSHRFRHPLRLLGPADAPRVAALLREVYGVACEPWLAVAFREGERCLAAEDAGDLLGLGWLQTSARSARLHGLTVRAGYRRLGIGTDLVLGRLAWAHRLGARRAISEIADRNLPSRATAERAGMRPAGRLGLYRAPPPVPPLAVRYG